MITLTFDMEKPNKANSNDHQELRSALERFNWMRMGGSVFIYAGADWLNEVVPALMFFRSFVLKRKIKLQKFTLHADSFTVVDSDAEDANPDPFVGRRLKSPFARLPLPGDQLILNDKPTSPQCSPRHLREFVTACTDAVRKREGPRGPRVR